MPENDKKLLRCAIYTRKSTQEGLEQAFNSLDAQREAGEAYIQSQIHQGWDLLPKHYDDGGFSGGSLERPALNELIADIAKGLVDVVVVYKVDRLSRSLHDFVRLIDIFDKFKVFFVSVTQQFDTTKPMGRLTLNVLLSFAQFEREVIGERIRDKIAASKRKGMWMGGTPPLGYTVKDRKLIIVPEEADAVRYIFQEYLNISKTDDLLNNIKDKGIRTKVWVGLDTKMKKGGGVFNQGMVHKLLHNRIYIGEIVHKDKSYPGEHDGIISKELFDLVQNRLNEKNLHAEHNQNQSSGLLRGLLFDVDDQAYSSKGGGKGRNRPDQDKQYHYYVSSRTNEEGDDQSHSKNIRIGDLDRLVLDHVRKMAPQQVFEGWDQKRLSEKRSTIRQYVEKAILHEEKLVLLLKTENESKRYSIPVQFSKRWDNKKMLDPTGNDVLDTLVDRDISLVAALVQAYKWRIAVKNNSNLKNIANREKLDPKYVEEIYELNFLSPRIKEAILDGTQPKTLTLRKLLKDMPVPWQEQESLYGF